MPAKNTTGKKISADEQQFIEFYKAAINSLTDDQLDKSIMFSLREVAYEMKQAEGSPMIKFYYEDETGFCVDITFLGRTYHGHNSPDYQRKLLPYPIEDVAKKLKRKDDNINIKSSDFHREVVFAHVLQAILERVQDWLSDRAIAIYVEKEDDDFYLCKVTFR